MYSNSLFKITNADRNLATEVIPQQIQSQPTLPPEIQDINPNNFDPFSFLFMIIPFLIAGIFVTVFGLFAYIIIKGISTASYNNKQPIMNREAKLVSKRQHVSGGGDFSTHTHYYATFEFLDGSREEFSIGTDEYGLIVGGDRGILQSQGTRYKGFQRQI